MIHNIESILGITVQNALNTVDDEAAESNMDADDNDDDDENDDDSTDFEDNDDEDVDAANFIVAPVAEPRGGENDSLTRPSILGVTDER